MKNFSEDKQPYKSGQIRPAGRSSDQPSQHECADGVTNRQTHETHGMEPLTWDTEGIFERTAHLILCTSYK
jgi:hypothetical protein